MCIRDSPRSLPKSRDGKGKGKGKGKGGKGPPYPAAVNRTEEAKRDQKHHCALDFDDRVFKFADIKFKVKVNSMLRRCGVKTWADFWDKNDEQTSFRQLLVDCRCYRGRGHGGITYVTRAIEGANPTETKKITQLSTLEVEDRVQMGVYPGQSNVLNGPIYGKVNIKEGTNMTGTATVTLYLSKDVLKKHSSASSRNCSIPMDLLSALFPELPELQELNQVLKDQQKIVKNKKLSTDLLMKLLERPDSLAAAPTPSGLDGELRPFQKQSLRWMLDQETHPDGIARHLWVKLVPLSPHGPTVYYSSLLGRFSSEIPRSSSGGFLCEEMGLGKTVESLALILSNPYDGVPPSDARVAATKATLVVCPVSLVGQWIAEANKFCAGLKVYMYHGTNRIRDPMALAEFDIVVTTYQTLGSDTGIKKNGEIYRPHVPVLEQLHWHRIILDESHNIKNKKTGFSKACCQLSGRHRWCATGTPFTSNLNDLEGQFSFLKFSPFDTEPQIFKSRLLHTLESSLHSYGGYLSPSAALAINLMRCCTMRHVKTNTIGGEKVLTLPPRTDNIIKVTLAESERELYTKVEKQALVGFQQVMQGGEVAMSKAFFKLHSLMLPLRQICAGGSFSISSFQNQNPGDEVHGNSSADQGMPYCDLTPDDEECVICQDGFHDPVTTSCKHWFCHECILSYFDTLPGINKTCPCCRGVVRVTELRRAKLENTSSCLALALIDEANPASDPTLNPDPSQVVIESKLNILVDQVKQVLGGDASAKILVFSQFHRTIEYLQTVLTNHGFKYRTINGAMPLKKRAKAIQAFQQDPPTTIFLLSVRSGAVGINLTSANHVFMLESMLNPSLEVQAIGRVHRMGQKRPVTIHKMCVKDSIEERIAEVVKRRVKGTQQGSADSDVCLLYTSPSPRDS
eukprot:TRINITY_DN7411_c0_g1_i2.p1 TRINITY_DN7411_c0_g1~~TRINITY_DN7411_c0_g1_i2.p1  ORF type:complete len:910 (-),score=179.13 TRINITY_DN7411_c0_g1_i2:138-2867(-)